MRISDWSSDVCSSDLIALMFESNAAFLAGLGSFLLAHLLFMLAFLHGVDVYRLPLWAWLFLGYGVALGIVLVRRAEARLRIPVVVYALEIGRASCRERVCQYV